MTWTLLTADGALAIPLPAGDPADRARMIAAGGPAEGPFDDLPWTERYELMSPVGEGGMGVVQRARDRVLGREVAFKSCRPELTGMESVRARMIAEAQIVAQLDHPGVPRLHDAGLTLDGGVYYTMDLFVGQCSTEVLAAGPDRAERGRIAHVLAIGARICDVLAHAHERGVVHRDVKPHNVFVGTLGEVVLADWGCALVRASDAEPGRTRVDTTSIGEEAGAVVGTLTFMAPEQFGKPDFVGGHSDVYALASTLFTWLTGERLREFGPGVIDVARVAAEIEAIRTRDRAPWLPKRVAEVLDAALEPEVALRTGSAQRFGAQLRALAHSIGRR